MTPTEPVGLDWRADPTQNRGAAGRRVLVPLLAIATAAALIVGLMFWLQPAKLPVMLNANTSSAPLAVADVKLLSTLPAAPVPVPLPETPSRDEVRAALVGLRRVAVRDSLVFTVGGEVEVDAKGELFLAPAVAGADHTRNRVPFTEVVQAVADCPASKKFLVLNVSSASADWVASAVRALDALPDPRRTALFAHGVGERSHVSPEWGDSVFAAYLAEGWRGAADGWNEGGAKDGRVTTDELAAFVRARVDRWSERNRTTPQTPWLHGDGTTFELATVTDAEPQPSAPRAYPQPLRDAWTARDSWIADGRAAKFPAVFRQLEKLLLTADRQWMAGGNGNIPPAQLDALDPVKNPPKEVVPPLLKNPPTATVTEVQAVTRHVARADAPPDPTEKPPAATASAVFAVAIADPALTVPKLKRLAALLAVAEAEPAGLLSLLLRRAATTAEPVSPRLVGRLIRVTAELEGVARDGAFFPWARAALDSVEADWRAAVALTFAPLHSSPADAEAAMLRTEDGVGALEFARQRFRVAVLELGDAERFSADDAVTAACQRLRAALTPPLEPPPTAKLATVAAGWTTATEEAVAVRTVAGATFAADSLARLRSRATGSTSGPAELDSLDRVLASPVPSAPDRVALWDIRTALSAKLHDEVRTQDRRDDDDLRASLKSSAWKDPAERPPSRMFDRRRIATEEPTDVARRAHEFLGWHAERFDDWATNPLDLSAFAADAEFASNAADACRRFGAVARPRPRIEWQSPNVVLTPSSPRQSVAVSLRLLGAEKAVSTSIEPLTPSTEWVVAESPTRVELSPIRAVTANIAVGVGIRPQAWPTPQGVLLKAVVDGRPCFRRLSVNTDALTNRLELLVKQDADGPTEPATAIRLRPNGKPASFTFVLRNPTAAPQTVVVRMTDPARETPPLTLAPGERKPLLFPAPVAAVSPPMVPAPVASITAPDEFTIQLLDPKTLDVRQSFSVPVKVLEPTESLTVRDVIFRPGNGKPSELSAVVGERESFRGGPMPVAMAFPADRNPGLVVPDGKLSGVLESGGAALKLYAANPAFDRAAGGVVTLTLSADGMDRAFVFRGDIASNGGVVRLQPVTTPRVKIVAPEFATGLEPLQLRFETENAPPTATLEIQVGTESGREFRLDTKQVPNPPAKVRSTTLAFDPKGPLALTAKVADTEVSLAVDALVGARQVRVRMLDSTGTEIARATKAVMFDRDGPRNVRFVDVPARAKQGAALTVRIAVDAPVSGVKEVKVFLGKPANNAPPVGAVLIPAKPNGREWTATIPLGVGPAPADITAQVVSGSGLSGFATATVELVPAAEFDKPKPGAITGNVVEGEVPQPGLAVLLFDDKNAKKGEAKTKPDGGFAFPDLPPGKYRIFCEKSSTGREKSLPVEVKPGETAAAQVSLVLK